MISLIGWITLVTGALVLGSWFLGIADRIILIPGGFAMQANAAFGYFLCGAALLLLQSQDRGKNTIHARICALIVLTLSLLSLLEAVTGWDLRIDGMIARGSGRMSLIAASSLVAISAALLLISLSRKNKIIMRISQALGSFLFCLSLYSLVDFITGINRIAYPLTGWHRIPVLSVVLAFLQGCAIHACAWVRSGKPIILSRGTIAVYLLTITLVVSVTTITVRDFLSLLASEEEQLQRLILIERIHWLQNLLDKEEDAQRGYLITGKQEYSAIMRGAESAFSRDVDKVRGMISGDSVGIAALSTLEAGVSEWRQVIRQETGAWEKSGLRAGTGAFLTEKAQILMDRNRRHIEEMITREFSLYSRISALSRFSQGWILTMLLVRMLFLVILPTWWIARMNGEMFRRHELIETTRKDLKQLNEALSSGRMGTWEMDLKSMTIERTPVFNQLFGPWEKPEPWLFGNFLERIHPTDRSTVDASFKECIRERKDWSFECRFLRMDRSEGWIWGRGVIIADTAGSAVAMKGVLGDISELHAIEETLRMSETRLRLATQASGTGVWDWNVVSNTVSWDEQMFRIYGIPGPHPERIDYNVWRNHVHPEDLAEQEAQLFRIRESGGQNVRTFRIIRENDREVRTLRASDACIPGPDGRTERIVGVNLDITDTVKQVEKIHTLNSELEKRAAQLENSVKELDAFTYSVSHDLRAPLRAIDGFSRILEEDYAPKLEEEGKHTIGVIRGEAQRMAKLIDDLLAFSRLGRQQLDFSEIDIGGMARDVFEELAAQEPGRTIHFNLHTLPPAFASGPMLRQLWVNLIGNAVKFTRNRETAEIEIGVRPGEAGEQVYFIRDNGAGFDMRYADKLFGVFQRLHTADEFPGTGVGLSLVQRIVQRHGGRIWGEGEVGKGATFSFTLPDHRKQNAPPPQPSPERT